MRSVRPASATSFPWQRSGVCGLGTVAGLASASADVVWAATSASMYRSDDAGASWTSAPGTRNIPLVEAIACAADGVLYACAAEALWRSRDGGATWQQTLAGRTLSLAVRNQLVLAGTEEDGLLRSEDGGQTWRGASAGLLDLTVLSIAMASDRVGFLGTPSGLYRTRNSAQSWRAVDAGSDEPAVQCIACLDERVVLAGTEADGILRSDDGGGTWQHHLSGGVTALAASARGIAAATDNGIFFSDDQGATWHFRGGTQAPVLALLYLGPTLLAGLHRGGAAVSDDDGASWRPANDGLAGALLTRVVIASDDALYAGGPEGVFGSSDAGCTWSCLTDAAVVGLCASAEDTLLAATADGVLVSVDRGSSWQQSEVRDAAAAIDVSAARVVAALAHGSIALSEDAAANWRILPRPSGDAGAIAFEDNRAVWLATLGATEVTVWRIEREWQRWLVERGAGIATLAPPLVAIGTRVLRPMRDAQEVHGRERRPMWRAVDVRQPVTALARHEQTVVLSTGGGAFISRDGGTTFDDWSEGLGARNLLSVAIKPPDVYALALGGTVWRRPLH